MKISDLDSFRAWCDAATKRMIENPDNEKAHMDTDTAMEVALRFIADGVDNPVEWARVALSVGAVARDQDIDFWYA